jgi:murein DD-endopeptidase MepM/ murein hydrolase activator NlpD
MLSRFIHWFLAPNHRFLKITAAMLALLATLMAVLYLYSQASFFAGPTGERFLRWAGGDALERESLIVTQREACPGAPFILPADGFIGLLYASAGGPYTPANPHQGIDIFSPDRETPGQIPVHAAYDGYITREYSWRSSLIQRLPDDPLQPGRQIWLYYTHMADPEGNDFIVDRFPPGAREVYVEQGTLLGYTGNYNGSSPRSIWVHLHFSIVNDDGDGGYLNELEFGNTVDPSPYLGMPVSDRCDKPPTGCAPVQDCA